MKYKKKPGVIDAIQWDGLNFKEIEQFTGNGIALLEEIRKPNPDAKIPGQYSLCIHTLEGVMEARIGDYIIRGVNGEYYPCKPDIFEKTYDIVKD